MRKRASTPNSSATSTSKGKAERERVDAGDATAHANAEPAEPQAASESKGPPGGTTTPGALANAPPALYPKTTKDRALSA